MSDNQTAPAILRRMLLQTEDLSRAGWGVIRWIVSPAVRDALVSYADATSEGRHEFPSQSVSVKGAGVIAQDDIPNDMIVAGVIKRPRHTEAAQKAGAE